MRTFKQLDAEYNITRFVNMWLEDYDRRAGYEVLQHCFEHVVNSEIKKLCPQQNNSELTDDK